MPKIATCCYCGTRAALVLRGKTRHELACSSCGAPLHDLKMLRADNRGEPSLVKPSPIRKPPKPAFRKHKRRRRKSFARWALEEAWDVLEDILD